MTHQIVHVWSKSCPLEGLGLEAWRASWIIESTSQYAYHLPLPFLFPLLWLDILKCHRKKHPASDRSLEVTHRKSHRMSPFFSSGAWERHVQ